MEVSEYDFTSGNSNRNRDLVTAELRHRGFFTPPIPDCSGFVSSGGCEVNVGFMVQGKLQSMLWLPTMSPLHVTIFVPRR